MNTEFLQDYIDGVADRGVKVRGIVVRHHGEVIAAHDFVAPERIQLFSASKSFTAMGVGFAVDEGFFGVDDRVVDLVGGVLPEALADGFDKLTVWHLLTMSTGHAECPIFRMQRIAREEMENRGETAPPVSRGRDGHMADNWLDAFCGDPLTFAPGEQFAYNNGASYLLSIIVQQKTGLSLVEFLMPRLFDKLGIVDPVWDTDPNGYCLGAIGLHLNTEEMSRAGQVLLDGGRWKGERLLSPEYVAAMTAKQVETIRKDEKTPVGAYAEGSQGYGYQVWRCTYPQAYRMDGMLGQFCIELPTLDAVVAITSEQFGDTSQILQLVWDTITPKLEALA